MVASIGPFWDANETWLVLGVGILLVAFPLAHGMILGALYLPVALMLVGLTLRGVAFDFRVKARAEHKPRWDSPSSRGSLLAALSQGVMLGFTIVGFRGDAAAWAFALLHRRRPRGRLRPDRRLLAGDEDPWRTAACARCAGRRSAKWLTAAGIAAVSLATPLVSERIAGKWFALPEFFMLLPIPLATLLLFFILWRSLGRLHTRIADGNEYGVWVPFACTIGIFMLAFYGLAYSLFPYLVVDRTTIWDAASAPGVADDHPGRRAGGAAGDPRLHGVRLAGVRGEGAVVVVRVKRGLPPHSGDPATAIRGGIHGVAPVARQTPAHPAERPREERGPDRAWGGAAGEGPGYRAQGPEGRAVLSDS